MRLAGSVFSAILSGSRSNRKILRVNESGQIPHFFSILISFLRFEFRAVLKNEIRTAQVIVALEQIAFRVT
jgi:hypothetical protein